MQKDRIYIYIYSLSICIYIYIYTYRANYHWYLAEIRFNLIQHLLHHTFGTHLDLWKLCSDATKAFLVLLRLEMRILPPIYCGITNNTNIHFVQTSKTLWDVAKILGSSAKHIKTWWVSPILRIVPHGRLLPTLICPAWQTRAVCKDHPKQGLRATCLLSGRGAGQKSAKTNCIPEQVVLVIRNVNVATVALILSGWWFQPLWNY